MGIVQFKFKDNDDSNILLCANRWKLYSALNDTESLLRRLNRGRTYREEWLYPTKTDVDEFGREKVTEYSAVKDIDEVDNEENNKAIEMIRVDYIVSELEDALNDVRSILWDIE